jgi:uncharacterized protein
MDMTWYGSYMADSGAHVIIAPWDMGEGHDVLSYLDTATGRLGVLRRSGESTYVSEPSLVVDLTIDVTLTFAGGACGRALLLEDGRSPAIPARALPIRRQDLLFSGAAGTLTGTLLIPDGDGPHPAVVLVHGSGSGRRESFGPLPYVFASHGLAVLTFDRRGSGYSDGAWPRVSIDDQAGDVLTAVAVLAERPDIDPDSIGLYGSSPGGWVAPLAAARSRATAFVVLVCGAGVEPFELQPRPEADRLQPFGSGGVAVAERVARRVSEQMPITVLEEITSPVLALFNDGDPLIPARESIARMGAALRWAGNTDHTLIALRHAEHRLLDTTHACEAGLAYAQRVAPGFLDTVLTWLSDRGFATM